MAIIVPQINVANQYLYDDNNVQTHIIQGICLVANHEISAWRIVAADSIRVKSLEDNVKMELCQQLVRKMFETDCIEFTKLHDATTDAVKYRARIFVTPNDNVQLLRIHGVIK